MFPPFETTICGLDALPGHQQTGISHVLSILDPEFPVPDAFGSFGAHERLELRFNDIIDPTPGMVLPGPHDIERLLAFARTMGPGIASQEARAGAARPNLLVHCHAGISRSTASMALIMAQAAPDMHASDIGQQLLRIRDKAWPNLHIIELGDAQLGRDGSLIKAAIAIYREQLERRPELAHFMSEAGRTREVQAARAH